VEGSREPVMNLRFPLHFGKFLSRSKSGGVPRRAQAHEVSFSVSWKIVRLKLTVLKGIKLPVSSPHFSSE
jgi:hypothetical protein